MSKDNTYNKVATEQIHTQMFALLGEIKIQTTEHNHRMTKVEKKQERFAGAAIASGVFLSVVIMPILAWGLWLLVQVQGVFDNPPAPTTEVEKEKALIDLQAQVKKIEVDLQVKSSPEHEQN